MSGNPANNDTPTTSTTLTFTPFASSLAPDFWVAFAQLKVDVLKLDDRVVDVAGHYSHGRTLLDRESGGLVALPASADYDGRAFGDGNDDAEVSRQSDRLFPGRLHNFNTVEAFRASDKQQIFASHAREVSDACVCALTPLTKPSHLPAVVYNHLTLSHCRLTQYIPRHHIRRSQKVHILLLVCISRIPRKACLGDGAALGFAQQCISAW